MSATASKAWLITGCSTGIGRALAQVLLSRGDQVAMTVRDLDTVSTLVAEHPSSARPYLYDVTETLRASELAKAVEAEFGRIDVLVNNAGYCLFGALEEPTPEQYREVFETNFFGPLSLIRAVLPGMRNRKRGQIINMSSMGGISGGPGLAYYAATKSALSTISESLALEASHLGIKVTIVEPGAHRTAARANWRMATPIGEYELSVGAARKTFSDSAGREVGSADLAALAIAKIADEPDPPLHLPLGRDALRRTSRKIASLAVGMDRWMDVALSTEG